MFLYSKFSMYVSYKLFVEARFYILSQEYSFYSALSNDVSDCFYTWTTYGDTTFIKVTFVSNKTKPTTCHWDNDHFHDSVRLFFHVSDTEVMWQSESLDMEHWA